MINGSLVKSIAMPGCKFLASKHGVFFSSYTEGQLLLYKMSEEALSGKSIGGIMPPKRGPGNVFARRMSDASLTTLSQMKDGKGTLSGRTPVTSWDAPIIDEDILHGDTFKRNPMFNHNTNDL